MNEGGCKLKIDDENMITKPNWWEPEVLFEVFSSLVIPGFEDSHQFEVHNLIIDLENIAKYTNVKLINSSEVAGSQIIARILKFKGNLNSEIDS